MVKIKVSYADGYKEVVAVDAPLRDAETIAKSYSERPANQGGRGVKVVATELAGMFEPKSDDHQRDLGGRW